MQLNELFTIIETIYFSTNSHDEVRRLLLAFFRVLPVVPVMLGACCRPKK